MVPADSDMVPEGSTKEQLLLAVMTSVWKKCIPPSLTLKPDNSVPPHMFLVPFGQLPQHWSSEPVSLSVSPSEGTLKGTPVTPAALHLTQPQSPQVFTASRYGDFSSQHWNLRLELGMSLGLLTPHGGPLQLRYPS